MQKRSKPNKKKKWSLLKTIAIVVTAIAAIIGAIAGIIAGLVTIANTVSNIHLPSSSVNLITDGGFDHGIISCTSDSWRINITQWCTNDPKNIVIDNHDNGDGATSATSAKLESNIIDGINTFLFSSAIKVAYGKTYEITYHLNLKHMKDGKVFVPYIDEFDTEGNDLKTGKYRKDAEISEPTNSTISLVFKPVSPAIAYARLYFIVIGNSDTLAYVDNVTWKETN